MSKELKIVYQPFTALRPSPNNIRLHSPEQIAQIAASIKAFGFNVPIAVDGENNILAGEGRYLAVKSLQQYKKNIPTISLAHLSEAQKRAYIIADNQIALNSTWDPAKLSKEILELMEMEFDVSTIGFDNDQLLEILKDNSTLDKVTAVSSHTRSVGEAKEKTGKGKTSRLAVLVFCQSAEDQEEVFGQLSDQGFECKNTVI
jgi:ParB-like chromosome segregation protein Spo0J